jgi:hypothetical protein
MNKVGDFLQSKRFGAGITGVLLIAGIVKLQGGPKDPTLWRYPTAQDAKVTEIDGSTVTLYQGGHFHTGEREVDPINGGVEVDVTLGGKDVGRFALGQTIAPDDIPTPIPTPQPGS